MTTCTTRLGRPLIGMLLCAVSVALHIPSGSLPAGTAHAANDDGGGDDGGGDDGGGDHGGGDDGGGDSGGSSGSGGASSGAGTSGAAGRATSAGGQNAQAGDQSLARRLKGKIAGVREIQSTARKAVPGEVINVRLSQQGTRYVYRVRIMQKSGDVFDVRIDASSRDLLSVRKR